MKFPWIFSARPAASDQGGVKIYVLLLLLLEPEAHFDSLLYPLLNF